MRSVKIVAFLPLVILASFVLFSSKFTKVDTTKFTEVDTTKFTEVDTTKFTKVDTTKFTEVDTTKFTEVDTTKFTKVDTTKFTEVHVSTPKTNLFIPWFEEDIERQKFLAQRQEDKRYPKGNNTRPIIILSWAGPMYFSHLELDTPSWTEGSPVDIVLTFNRSRLLEAHIVLFHLSPQNEILEKMKSWQMSALLTLEPYPSTSVMKNILSGIDILVSYSRYSEVIINYKYALFLNQFSGGVANYSALEMLTQRGLLNRLPELTQKRTDAIAAFFISNCVQWRIEYITQLSQFFSLHSYGSCLHTPNLSHVVDKIPTLSDYRFVLSFENSIMEDYISEKFYEGMCSDAISIYLGAPNYISYLPKVNKIVINALEYPDPADLAKFMNYLASNDTAYLEYFAWRQQPKICEQLNNQYNFEIRGPQSWISRLGKWYVDHVL